MIDNYSAPKPLVKNSIERRFYNNDEGMDIRVVIQQYDNAFKRTMRILLFCFSMLTLLVNHYYLYTIVLCNYY